MQGERLFLFVVFAFALAAVAFGVGHWSGKLEPRPGSDAVYVPSGKHDRYYAFLPGGPSGEVWVHGLPSGRVLTRIPVFEPRAGQGYAATPHDPNHRALMTTGGTGGDVRGLALSLSHQLADGKWLYALDRAHARVARVSLATFGVDKLARVSGVQGPSGLALTRPGGGTLLVAGEFEDPQGGGLVAVVDAEGLVTRHLVRLTGNAYQVATDRGGRWALVTGYNREGASSTLEMTREAEDYLVAVDLAACERARRAPEAWLGVTTTQSDKGPVVSEILPGSPAEKSKLSKGDVLAAGLDAGNWQPGQTVVLEVLRNSLKQTVPVPLDVPVLDARKNVVDDLRKARAEGRPGVEVLAYYIPVPRNPAGVTVTPDGQYAVVSGKLADSVTVVRIADIDQVKLERLAIAAEPRLGRGPIATAASGRGTLYTALYEESAVVQWDVEKAVARRADYVVDRTPVRFKPVGLEAASDGSAGTGEWLLALCATSLDQYLPVGSASPASVELLAVDRRATRRLGQFPVASVSPGAAFLLASRLAPRVLVTEEGAAAAAKPGLSRQGSDVTVELALSRGRIQPEEFEVKQGDRVTLRIANLDRIPGHDQGLGVTDHVVNAPVPAGGARSVTFSAGTPGTYWYYVTRATSILAPETRGRMVVTAR